MIYSTTSVTWIRITRQMSSSSVTHANFRKIIVQMMVSWNREPRRTMHGLQCPFEAVAKEGKSHPQKPKVSIAG